MCRMMCRLRSMLESSLFFFSSLHRSELVPYAHTQCGKPVFRTCLFDTCAREFSLGRRTRGLSSSVKIIRVKMAVDILSIAQGFSFSFGMWWYRHLLYRRPSIPSAFSNSFFFLSFCLLEQLRCEQVDERGEQIASRPDQHGDRTPAWPPPAPGVYPAAALPAPAHGPRLRLRPEGQLLPARYSQEATLFSLRFFFVCVTFIKFLNGSWKGALKSEPNEP